MTNKKILLGALVIVLAFGMMAVGCANGSTSGSGVLDGTTWIGNNRKELTFTGSNYSYDNGASTGTYTLASDGKDLKYKETSPGSNTYKGYYFPDYDPPCVIADFNGSNEDFFKK